MGIFSQAGSAIAATTTVSDFILKGTAEANSTVDVFDGSKQIGAVKADAGGAWSLDTGNLAAGGHTFTSEAVDAAGNTSSASAAVSVGVSSANGFQITNGTEGDWGFNTITGIGSPNSIVKLYDGTKSIGSTVIGADGTWSFETARPVTDAVHKFTAQEVDSQGHVLATSAGSVIKGSTKADTLTSTAGNDFFTGDKGSDTFVFAQNFGKDVINDFTAAGRSHDTIQFAKSEFADFASVLAHASQVGGDVVISSGSDSLTLKNMKLSALDSHDFHFG